MKSRGGAEERRRRAEERRGEERRAEERRSEKRKSQKKENPGARKGRKVAKHCVFPMICGFGGSKSRLAKAAGAEPAGQMRDEKLHAVVARNTFQSQNVQNTPGSDHFWMGFRFPLPWPLYNSVFGLQNVKKIGLAPPHFVEKWRLFGTYIFQQTFCRERTDVFR